MSFMKDKYIHVNDGTRDVVIDRRDGTRYELVRERGQMAYLRRLEGVVPRRRLKGKKKREAQAALDLRQRDDYSPRWGYDHSDRGDGPRVRTGHGSFVPSASAQGNWSEVLKEVASHD